MRYPFLGKYDTFLFHIEWKSGGAIRKLSQKDFTLNPKIFDFGKKKNSCA